MIIKHTQTLALQTVADEKHYLLKPGVGSVNNGGKALTGGHTQPSTFLCPRHRCNTIKSERRVQ